MGLGETTNYTAIMTDYLDVAAKCAADKHSIR